MPTISGIRRRGYTPEAVRDFCERIGVAKANSLVDSALLDHCIREDLNSKAARVMTVLRPLKLVIDNYPEGQVEYLTAENNPESPEMGERQVAFSRELYIEQDDFMEEPVKKFFRLAPEKEVRLKHAYIIKCESIVKDEEGNIVEVHCTYDPESKTGGANAGRKVKGTLHWVSAQHSVPVEVRLYDYLMLGEQENEADDFIAKLNPNSLEVLTSMAEASIKDAKIGDKFQFLRQGYFCIDQDTTADKIVINRIVGLRDSWAKQQKKG
jgi:glutaminyl-tRNA synthetase